MIAKESGSINQIGKILLMLVIDIDSYLNVFMLGDEKVLKVIIMKAMMVTMWLSHRLFQSTVSILMVILWIKSE